MKKISILMGIILVAIIIPVATAMYGDVPKTLINQEEQKDSPVVICNVEETLGYEGYAPFGILYVTSSSIEGVPENTYTGIIGNLNITLSGDQTFSVVPLPWFILSTYFENSGIMYINMELFWGLIDPTGTDASLSGFGKNIEWKWE